MIDLAGIDVGFRIRQGLGIPSGSERSSAVADRLAEMGSYGQKTGAGFYRYEEGSRAPVINPEVDEIVSEAVEIFGVERRAFTDEEIVARCIYPMINEAARILEEGIALRPSDIDIVWINGYGFPPYRGGPMHFADRVGVKKIYDTICEYRDQFGDQWQPAPLLKKLADKDRTFASLGLMAAGG
jgi:3-hydroxyacyl-CoA dehydrogenase